MLFRSVGEVRLPLVPLTEAGAAELFACLRERGIQAGEAQHAGEAVHA